MSSLNFEIFPKFPQFLTPYVSSCLAAREAARIQSLLYQRLSPILLVVNQNFHGSKLRAKICPGLSERISITFEVFNNDFGSKHKNL